MDDFGLFLYNNWLLFLALVVILALLMRATIGTGSGGVGPQDATQMLNHDNAVVLDVREPSEIANGTIRGALTIPLGELGDRLKELEKYKSKPIIVACRSGQRSSRACGILRKNEFTRVYNLSGGIMAWQNANLPLGKPKGGKKG